MNKINDRNYIAIADWMIKLDLTPKELLLYALIYGFSQDQESSFTGSLTYMADWLNTTNSNNVINQLDSLQEKKLITKEKVMTQKGYRCSYKVTKTEGDITNFDYIYIAPFMIRDLKLSGRELLLYALIHGFSKNGSNSFFTGNMSYIAKWLNVKANHVRERYLQKLIDKKLITEEIINDVKKYKTIFPETTSQNYSTTPNSDNPKNIVLAPKNIVSSPKIIDNILINSSLNTNVVVDIEEKIANKLTKVLSQYGLNYNSEIALFSDSDLKLAESAFPRFVLSYLDDNIIEKLLNSQDYIFFELFDMYKSIECKNSINNNQYKRIDNPIGFMISEFNKKLNK